MGSLQTATIVLVFSCAGLILLILGLFIQKSGNRRGREALRNSEQRHLLALERSTDGLWDWEIPEDTVFYSDRFQETLGYSPSELPGRIDSFRSRIHPEDLAATWSAIEGHLQEGCPFYVEFRLRTKSGSYLWILSRGQAIWDAAGNPVRMSGWIQDITERKEAELNLKTALCEIKELKEHLETERAYLREEIKSNVTIFPKSSPRPGGK